ncbi:MAG: hypothetical protein E7679_02725 [Ruminococcaceae bacterium]|nr:hypothetical protein [Oscillospiraceae bacterium]
MENEKLKGSDIKVEGRFSRWLENYWYHYKWPTIIVSFFVIVVLVCTIQMCTKETEDTSVVYAGPVQLSSGEMSAIESVMNFIMPEDFDGNGKKTLVFLNYHVYSENQIKGMESEREEQIEDYVENKDSYTVPSEAPAQINRQYNTTNYKNFIQYIQTGETSICFLDASVYEELLGDGRIMKLSDVLGYESEASADGYGIKLSELGIYETYAAVRKLPADTVVCILKPLVAGRNSKAEMYQRDKDMLRAIVEFKGDEN